MVRIRQLGAALALMGVLALSPTPLSAAPTWATPQGTVKFCNYLAQAIAFLELQPSSPLRDFLLDALGAAKVKYCTPTP